MALYANGFKARMVQRMTGPRSISAIALSREVGVPQPTLSTWLREARKLTSMVRPERDRRLSPATGERFRKRCCVGLAGGSPVAVSAGAPRSRFRAAGEIPPSERNVESPQGVVRSLGGEQRRRPNARA